MNRDLITTEVYDNAERWSLEIASDHEVVFDPLRFRQAVKHTAKEIGIPAEALQSLVRNASVNRIKRKSPEVRRCLPNLLERYKSGSSIVNLAKDVDFSPYLLARYMVEEISTFKGKMLSEAMRDPEGLLSSIEIVKNEYHATENLGSTMDSQGRQSSGTNRLVMQVRNAINTDPLYGPLHDKERHIVGIEYEVVLEQELTALGIPYETEADLRGRGTSRTPDILLSCPLGIQVQKMDGNGKEWKMITWIDSKAMFGDATTHRTSVLPQAEAYIHRYGPGMVLYWFGHAPLERLDNSQGDIVIESWDLPDTYMWPTGEVLNREI